MIQTERYGPVIALRMARRLLGKPFYWTTAYWLDGLLIDTGPAVTARELVRVLEKIGVSQIALTHGHEDHIGGLAALRERFPNVPVYASARTIPFIEAPERLGMQLYRRMVWGTPAAVQGATPLEEVGDVLRTPGYTLRAVETPGHCRDHVAYLEPHERRLFSGDAFIGGRDRTWAPEYDLFGVLSSLRALASLRPEQLFPGSGNVRRNPQDDLKAKIEYLEELAAQVAELEAQQVESATIAARLLGSDWRMAFWTQGHFSALHLVEACRSYNAFLAPASPPANRRRGVVRVAGARKATTDRSGG